MTMKSKISFLIFIIGLCSCTIPKEARVQRRTTKSWRQSSVVLNAYADTPFAGIFLTLRENGKFEHTSSGVLKSFVAGAWTNSRDTICLSYMDSKQNINLKKKVIVDRKTSTLIFEGDDSPVHMRLRVRLNKL